jgi:transposase
VRRKIFDALPTAPDAARRGLELILDVYRIEHEAKARKVVRTAEHLALRQSRSRAAMARLREWLVDEQPKHVPKSPLGTAVSYALNQWERLLCFLENVNIPVDNNASESALRVVALGRKNFLFVGDVEAGDHLATLYSLVSTCEAHDIDPVAYLKDVLMRVDTHPAAGIDELLPHKWTPPLRWSDTS